MAFYPELPENMVWLFTQKSLRIWSGFLPRTLILIVFYQCPMGLKFRHQKSPLALEAKATVILCLELSW
jgi:hypothetical protein